MRRRWPGWLLSGLVLAFGVSPAAGHDLNTTSLRLDEVEPGTFRVRWESSSAALAGDIVIPAVFPAPCRLEEERLVCGAAGLMGTIALPWLEGSETSVMVAITWRNGDRLLRVVTGSMPRLAVYGAPVSAGMGALVPIAADYARLGIGHILTGYDHLLFVVALALLLRGGRRLVAAITAFTIAHSLTLAAAVLGLVRIPVPPVEAVIALSIVFVCAEVVRPQASLIRRAPWAVTFVFGLLHGLGFASSLLAIGLPATHLPAALLFFNVGVELGQLAILALVGLLALLVRRLAVTGARGKTALAYAMGSVAAYWSLARVLVALRG